MNSLKLLTIKFSEILNQKVIIFNILLKNFVKYIEKSNWSILINNISRFVFFCSNSIKNPIFNTLLVLIQWLIILNVKFIRLILIRFEFYLKFLWWKYFILFVYCNSWFLVFEIVFIFWVLTFFWHETISRSISCLSNFFSKFLITFSFLRLFILKLLLQSFKIMFCILQILKILFRIVTR